MRLEWSAFAISDREAIFNYIEADSPKSAVLVDERIRKQVERLVQFPESGRPGRIEGTRELVVPRTPFVIAYRVEHAAVVILRALHGAQMWPDELPSDRQ